MSTEEATPTDQRDWKPALAWAIAAFAFGSIVTQTPSIPLDNGRFAVASSLVLAVGWMIVAALAGFVHTILTKKPSRLMIPFWTAPANQSVRFFILWAAGLLTKAYLFNLGAIGVVLLLLLSFLCLTTIWPSMGKKLE